jgi:L-lactate dehydrogenase complex protein LldG
MVASAMSPSARDVILERVRRAQAIRPVSADVTRDYLGAGETTVADPIALLVERIGDYNAKVRTCAPADLAATITAALADRGARRIVSPTGLPAAWVAAVPEPMPDEPPLTNADLDGCDGVLTAVAVAIAATGTLVLDAGAGQGRRALTLVPDYHLAVVDAAQVVTSVPDAVAALDPVRPLTWISGPSATSDIELSRVEGVHGPRTLEVILVIRVDA